MNLFAAGFSLGVAVMFASQGNGFGVALNLLAFAVNMILAYAVRVVRRWAA